MKKDKQQKANVKQTNTKNMDYSYILKTAVGHKNMENLNDYDIEIVASDKDLAGEINARFNEVGANNVKTSYLEPAGPVTYNKRELRFAPIRKFVKYEAPVEVVAEPVEAVEEPVGAVEEPAEAVVEPVETVAEPAEAVAEPVETVEEPTEIVEEPAEAAAEEETASIDEA